MTADKEIAIMWFKKAATIVQKMSIAALKNSVFNKETTMKKAKIIFVILGIIAIAVMGYLPQLKTPLEAGLAAYAEQDYAQAITLFTEAADKGDAKAQYNLGTMYEAGEGVSV